MVTIRSCRLADIPAVRRVLRETWHATYDDLLGVDKVREISAAWHSAGQLTRQVGRPGSLFLVTDCADDIVATSFAHDTGQGTAEIGRLYVRPSRQNAGIGAGLLEATLAGFANVSGFHLEVEPRNIAAIRFYQRHGFRIIAAGTDSGGNGSGLAHLRMERPGSASPSPVTIEVAG